MAASRTKEVRNGAIISGDVCLVRLCVESRDDQDLKHWPWRFIEMSDNGADQRLRKELTSTVEETLGSEFEVRSLTFGRGSLVILAAIGVAYHAIASYKDFVDSIVLMVSQLKAVIRRFFEHESPRSVAVSATWTPGFGLMAVRASSGHASVPQAPSLVMWYLVLSHAAILTVLLWMLLSSLHP